MINLILIILVILLLSIKLIDSFTTEELHYCKQNCQNPTSKDDKKGDCHKLVIDGKTQHLCHSYCKPGMPCNDDKCVASCPFTRF